MKKFIALISVLAIIITAVPVSAYKIGDTVGYALTTDIVATINGYHIPSYNVDGHTYIVVEDLKYYGFAVYYDNSSRSLSVSRDYSQSWVSKSYTKPSVLPYHVGKRAHSLLYTDIKTYLDGYYTHSYNINGQTIIRFDALSAYGGVSYDNGKREISLGLSGLNYNPSPVDRSNVSLTSGMAVSDYRELNLFLSNFSEAYYDPDDSYYTNSDEQKIMFAYLHAIINYNSMRFSEGAYYGISASNVDTILYRFFGKTVPHRTPSGSKVWKYKNGKFLIPAADGESYGNFSLATGMYPNGNGTYRVTFNIYCDDTVCCGNIIEDKTLYSLTPDTVYPKCSYIGYGTAIVKPKTHNGSNTYELVDYTVKYTY